MLRSAQRLNSSSPVCAPSKPRHLRIPCCASRGPERRPPLFFFSRSPSDLGHGSDQAGVRPHGAPARPTTARGSLFFNLFTLMRPATCPPRHMALVPQNHADGACCLTLPSCVFSDGAQILWRQGAQQAADQGGPFESAASPGRAQASPLSPRHCRAA